MQAADAFVDGLLADGGTEMLEPLLAAVGMLGDAERDRVVVLLTDGQVGNEAQIVERVVQRRGKGVRISHVRHRHERERRAGERSRAPGRRRGRREFIHPGERIDEKVTAQFARATAVRVTGLEARFEGIDVGELAPAERPALVDGEPWVPYGRYGQPGMGRLSLRGTSARGALPPRRAGRARGGGVAASASRRCGRARGVREPSRSRSAGCPAASAPR